MCTPRHPIIRKFTSKMYTFSPFSRQNCLHCNHRTGCFSIHCLAQQQGQPDRNQTLLMTPHRDCNSTPPKVHTPSPRIPEPTIPPTPYVNQAAVEQHIRTQSPSVPPRNIATVAPPPRESPQASFAQETLITLATSQITPP